MDAKHTDNYVLGSRPEPPHPCCFLGFCSPTQGTRSLPATRGSELFLSVHVGRVGRRKEK